MSNRFKIVVDYIKTLYPNENPVPLHAPRFFGNEKKYLNECIDSSYVSYVGQYVTKFEEQIKEFTGAKYAIAMVNGTASLQIALITAGLKEGEEVITQALTFVATANAIVQAGGDPVFIDVEKKTMGMCPEKLEHFLKTNTQLNSDGCYNKKTGKKIKICVPMHTFGHPVSIKEIIDICNKYKITVIEDSAESLGSYYKNKHTGTFGKSGILSFNGNKPVTTGGGGMIITDDTEIAEKSRHLSTTAKIKHPWNFYHDQIGYNLRMPNINAAVGSAQMEKIDIILSSKRELSELYKYFFKNTDITFFTEPEESMSNYWLNAIILKNKKDRDDFLKYSNDCLVQVRPIWILMNKLPMFSKCFHGNLDNSAWFEDRVVNLPSSVRL